MAVPSYDDDLRLAHVLADAVERVTVARFRAADLVVESKPDLSPVTDADRAAEELVRHQLKRTRPRDAVQGEEFDTTGHGPRRWVIDPIDGTKNFVRGVPVWATLISLVDDGQPVLGLVAAPALNRRWWAAGGSGAWCGRSLSSAKRMHVSKVATVTDASLSHSSISSWRKVGRYDEFLGLADCWRTRAYGDFWSYMLARRGGRRHRGRAGARGARHGRAGADRHRGRWPVHLPGRHPRPVGGNAVATNGILHDEVLARIGTRSVDPAPEDY